MLDGARRPGKILDACLGRARKTPNKHILSSEPLLRTSMRLETNNPKFKKKMENDENKPCFLGIFPKRNHIKKKKRQISKSAQRNFHVHWENWIIPTFHGFFHA